MAESQQQVKKKPIVNFVGGPHGHGDPDDQSLRKVESEVLIPKKIREKSRKEKCAKQAEAFSKCSAENGLLMVFKCRNENFELKACLGEWFRNPELVAECTKEYLAERTEYRRTGIGKKARDQRM